jgi:predicted permease
MTREWINAIWLKVSRLMKRSQLDRDLRKELSFHLAMRQEKYRAAGLTSEEAAMAARRRFGNVTGFKEACRDMWTFSALETVGQDIRYGLRQLRRSPGFTAAAVLTLALGIGANAAIFSLVNAFALRPLPVKNAGRLAVIAVQSGAGSDPDQISYPDYLHYDRDSSAFAGMTFYDLDIVGLGYNGHADRIIASYVPDNFFEMLGLRPAVGRLIQAGEDGEPGTVVVLGYDYWEKHFGGDSGIVGKTVDLDGRPVTVIGVAPKKFQGPYAVIDMSVYAPIGMINHAPDLFRDRHEHDLNVLGTLKPGISDRQAQANLQVIADRLAQKYPEADKGQIIRVFPERIARPVPAVAEYMPLVATVFLVLVGLVLLVACFNVANLLLARAAARDKEIAVRAALGAGRFRLMRQMLTESILLAVAGGLGGAIAGRWIVGIFQNLRPMGGFAIHFAAPFDWRVFGYVATAVLLAGILAGIGASLRVRHARPQDVLHEAGRGVIGRRGRFMFRNILMTAQIAISMVLLVAAGLFVRSLARVESIDLGFNPHHVLNAGFDPKLEGYDVARTRAFCRALLRDARRLPGVESASLAYSFPEGYYSDYHGVYAEGQPAPPESRVPGAEFNAVSPGYFRTLGMRILNGRAFNDADTAKSLPVAIVDQTMAERFWPHQNAIGRRFSDHGPAGPWLTVVGVVQDAKITGLTDKPGTMFYAPETQLFRAIHVLQLRTSVSPDSLSPEVESLFRQLDPNMPVYDVMSMEDSLQGANGFFLFKIAAAIAATLGSLGLVLAAVGLYGVISFGASQRTHEIGIRMALGAHQADVLTMVARRGLALAVAGVAVGACAALAVTRFLSTLLYGVKPTDPLTFIAVSATLISVALLACYIPARRAARVDPMVALRWE